MTVSNNVTVITHHCQQQLTHRAPATMTHLASPVSTINPTFIRSFSRTRWLWVAPSANRELHTQTDIHAHQYTHRHTHTLEMSTGLAARRPLGPARRGPRVRSRLQHNNCECAYNSDLAYDSQNTEQIESQVLQPICRSCTASHFMAQTNKETFHMNE